MRSFLPSPHPQAASVAFALEHSGLDWRGEYIEFPDWKGIKPTLTFGCLPVAEVPGVGTLAHELAILNYIGATSLHMRGATTIEFVTSQQLLCMADAMYQKVRVTEWQSCVVCVGASHLLSGPLACVQCTCSCALSLSIATAHTQSHTQISADCVDVLATTTTTTTTAVAPACRSPHTAQLGSDHPSARWRSWTSSGQGLTSRSTTLGASLLSCSKNTEPHFVQCVQLTCTCRQSEPLLVCLEGTAGQACEGV
jgi:hypothetical protein